MEYRGGSHGAGRVGMQESKHEGSWSAKDF